MTGPDTQRPHAPLAAIWSAQLGTRCAHSLKDSARALSKIKDHSKIKRAMMAGPQRFSETDLEEIVKRNLDRGPLPARREVIDWLRERCPGLSFGLLRAVGHAVTSGRIQTQAVEAILADCREMAKRGGVKDYTRYVAASLWNEGPIAAASQELRCQRERRREVG